MSVVGVEHCDVPTLVLQVHLVLQLLQRLVRTHVGVGELCTGKDKHDTGDGCDAANVANRYFYSCIQIRATADVKF